MSQGSSLNRRCEDNYQPTDESVRGMIEEMNTFDLHDASQEFSYRLAMSELPFAAAWVIASTGNTHLSEEYADRIVDANARSEFLHRVIEHLAVMAADHFDHELDRAKVWRLETLRERLRAAISILPQWPGITS